ncbi:MAG: hypothetical protein WCP06_02740 [Verrucomicrobiota bacterium]
MNTNTVTFTEEEWRRLRSEFSELKHSVNNALAVFMALSELAQRNPANFEKLTKSIGTRTPEIVAVMQKFHELLDRKAPGAPDSV